MTHGIRYGAGEFHFGDLRVPTGRRPHPVVVVIHGGFWRAAYDLTHTAEMAEALTHRGVATWNIEYRRIGHQGGGYPGTLDDVASAVRHLARIAPDHGLDPHRIVAAGHSAGGHLALWLAASEPLQGAVSLGGVADLRRAYELKLSNTVVGEFLGGSPDQVPGRYRAASPIERLPARVPVRLVHGQADDIVPIEIAERYAAAARAKGQDCRLVRLDCGHFDVVRPHSCVWSVVEDTILELAGPQRRHAAGNELG